MEFILPILGFIAVTLLVITIPRELEVFANSLVSKAKEKTGLSIEGQPFYGIPAEKIFKIVSIIAVVVGILVWLLTNSFVISILFFCFTIFVPKWVHSYIRSMRIIEFDERLPAALDQMSSSAKAGLSLAQAMEQVGLNSPKPINEEFMAIYQEHKLGTDLSQTIVNARERIGSRPFSLVASALLVNIDKGGNLPDALETLSESLKEIWRLEQKMVTASAEGKKAMWVISGVPIFVALLVFVAQPELAATLTGTLVGIIILTAAILVYALGIYWLRSILKQEI